MPHPRTHLTPARVAAVAAAAVLSAISAPPLIGFYVSLVSVAVLLGTAFAAYLAVVDDPREWQVFELGACTAAALFTVAGTSLRFPAVVAGSTPSAAVNLAWLSLAVAAAAAVASLARGHLGELGTLRDEGIARVIRRI
jgi:hypothetical protein